MNKREFLSRLTKSTALIVGGLTLADEAEDPKVGISTGNLNRPLLYSDHEGTLRIYASGNVGIGVS